MIAYILIYLLSLFGQLSETDVFNKFLLSKNLANSHEAFIDILANEDEFKDIVLENLNQAEKDKTRLDPKLIYLASYFRDERYIPILVSILNDKDYSYEKCIYSCPIIFALTLYEEFTNYELANLDSSISPVQDLIVECERVKKIKLINDDGNIGLKGPGVDSAIEKGIQLDNSKLIEFAGPFNKDDELPRFVAVEILAHRLIDPNYLVDLFWLAINEEKDASMEFRSSIYFAIYKTEKYNLMK